MGLLVKLEASERECKKLRKERSGEGSGIRLVIGYVDERFKLVFFMHFLTASQLF